MDAPELRAALARLPHFRGLSPDQLESVAELARPLDLRAGDIVFREGQDCDGLYVIVQGAVRIFRLGPDGSERVVHTIPAGRTFADAALFHHGVFPANAAAAADPTVLLRLAGGPLLELIASEPTLGRSMVGSLSSWLHLLLDRIEILTLASAGARLSHYLLRLPAVQGEDGLVVELPVAKRELAAELSITPETLSRLLARWRSRDMVAVDGRRITLRQVDALTAVAEPGEL